MLARFVPPVRQSDVVDWTLSASASGFKTITARIGDTIQFNTDLAVHNVVLLSDTSAYKICDFSTFTDITSAVAPILFDIPTVDASEYYFFACSVSSHCSIHNQKITVRVSNFYASTPPPTLTPTLQPTTSTTVAVEVAVAIEASACPTSEDKMNLLSLLALSAGVDESSIKEFGVDCAESLVRQRLLLRAPRSDAIKDDRRLSDDAPTSFTWDIGFQIQVDAASMSVGDDDEDDDDDLSGDDLTGDEANSSAVSAVFSSADLAADVSSKLATELVSTLDSSTLATVLDTSTAQIEEVVAKTRNPSLSPTLSTRPTVPPTGRPSTTPTSNPTADHTFRPTSGSSRTKGNGSGEAAWFGAASLGFAVAGVGLCLLLGVFATYYVTRKGSKNDESVDLEGSESADSFASAESLKGGVRHKFPPPTKTTDKVKKDKQMQKKPTSSPSNPKGVDSRSTTI